MDVVPPRHNYNKVENFTDDITQYGENMSFAFQEIMIQNQSS
jgi:hypothetical protein